MIDDCFGACERPWCREASHKQHSKALRCRYRNIIESQMSAPLGPHRLLNRFAIALGMSTVDRFEPARCCRDLNGEASESKAYHLSINTMHSLPHTFINISSSRFRVNIHTVCYVSTVLQRCRLSLPQRLIQPAQSQSCHQPHQTPLQSS